jgi:hypothetical protein
VFVEYAKADPEDVLVQITVHNRGPEAADLHLLPTLWFRNDWATWISRRAAKPTLTHIDGPAGTSTVAAIHGATSAPIISTVKATFRSSLRRTRRITHAFIWIIRMSDRI